MLPHVCLTAVSISLGKKKKKKKKTCLPLFASIRHSAFLHHDMFFFFPFIPHFLLFLHDNSHHDCIWDWESQATCASLHCFNCCLSCNSCPYSKHCEEEEHEERNKDQRVQPLLFSHKTQLPSSSQHHSWEAPHSQKVQVYRTTPLCLQDTGPSLKVSTLYWHLDPSVSANRYNSCSKADACDVINYMEYEDVANKIIEKKPMRVVMIFVDMKDIKRSIKVWT